MYLRRYKNIFMYRRLLMLGSLHLTAGIVADCQEDDNLSKLVGKPVFQ